jgi:hypothetical protein
MAKVLLLTNTLGASAEVLPALGLLQHQVKILPAEASVLVDAPEVDLLLLMPAAIFLPLNLLPSYLIQLVLAAQSLQSQLKVA